MTIMLQLFLLSVFPTLPYMLVRDIEKRKEMRKPGESSERGREKKAKSKCTTKAKLWAL